ncbi:MarR family winged helix-turn-helix transcriptional regulator [Bosea sp. (in: a-proteobacteria)]|jgi:DNA-binding MarR family transcriptional regulator|uniref:MarR family winged helix-turn-helix transcriptional regulator n=1 Tax=Bosea sp. (in: a-proteobacteria) TaxID=1871050 RepID=UPI00356902A5
MYDPKRTANLLGAAVLALHDEMRGAVERIAGRSGESPAALVALGHQPGLSNEGLRRLLALSHPGSVRLIDRLVEDGLVERRQCSRDGRAVALYLTAAGERTRHGILAERETVVLGLVEQLSAKDQAGLTRALEKLLRAVSRDDEHKLRICRLCDGDPCVDCPIHVSVADETSLAHLE